MQQFDADAASFVDPLTGEGIYTALKSGLYAAESASKALSEGDACRACHNYEKLWRKEFLFNDFLIGDVYQYLLKNRFLLEKLLERAAKNQYHADLLAAVFGHYQKKITLLKLITPFR